MAEERWLEWDGCVNVRDLGGLPTAKGQQIRPGALVRADSTYKLTEAGWAAARDHGITTVIDLRHPREAEEQPITAPLEIAVVALPVEDQDDTAFVERWGAQLATPHYYPDALDRFADRVAAVVTAVAQAPPGGVVVQCVAGRDRTGMVTALLLSLAGVDPELIAADHALSYQRLPFLHGDHGPGLDDGWEADHAAALTTLLAGMDVASYLGDAGVTAPDVEALRARFVSD
ncbi:tyrosine-protein phosphatase [soil metagenome]